MMRFIETIKIENGIAHNLGLHLERASETCFHHFGVRTVFPFETIINEIRSSHNEGIYKLRIIYTDKIEHYTIEQYQPKIVKTLKIVDGGNIDYSFKYEDRSELEKLLSLRGECDDIIIIKDGFVTDTSYSNIVFMVGGKLFTPSNFILSGIKRESMLQKGLIYAREIRFSEIDSFEKIFMINSMLDLYFVEKVVW